MTFTALGWRYLISYFGSLGLLVLLTVGVLVLRRRFRHHGSHRFWIANVWLSCQIVLAMLLVLEGYFAFCYDTTDSWALLNTSQLWVRRHAPRANNLGARERGMVAREKLPGTTRIFFLGDSFTWGHGIARERDRFSELVAEDVWRRSRTGSDGREDSRHFIECHNISYLGINTSDELEVLGDLLNDGFEFDILILAYCINDVADLVPECIEITYGVYARNPDFFLVRDTYFFNFLYHRWTSMRGAAYRDYFGDVRRGYDGPAWEAQREQLGEIVTKCREANIELRVVTFPFLHELGEHYSQREAHAKLAEFWAEQSVPHIDLLDVYSRYRPAELVVNRFDAHPNELAHRLAAQTILARWFAALPPRRSSNSDQR